MIKKNNLLRQIGYARIIIFTFFIVLLGLAFLMEIPVSQLLSDVFVRFGMNGILVLAGLPSIIGGIGLNFALPLGIVCGLLGGVVSFELGFLGIQGFLAAMLTAIPIAVAVGTLYGILMNKVKGSEMTVATYIGFASVSLMSIVWLVLPFNNPQIVWPIGKGLRTTISLETSYNKILNSLFELKIGNFVFPTGLMMFFLIFCLIVWIFFRTRAGACLKACGENALFAKASGIDVDRYRIISSILSTSLGAIGIVVYAQSFGFFQLYQAPMYMGFAAVAAILIGGASASKARIGHVILGTFLFQGILTISLPVANKLVTHGNLAEVVRIIVSNGIILYALTRVGREEA